jgi:hypothetical protein
MTPESKCETPVALAKALAKLKKNGGAVMQEKLMNFPGILKIGITYPQTMQVSVEDMFDLLNNVHATRVDQRFDFVSWPKLSDHTHLSSLGYYGYRDLVSDIDVDTKLCRCLWQKIPFIYVYIV